MRTKLAVAVMVVIGVVPGIAGCANRPTTEPVAVIKAGASPTVTACQDIAAGHLLVLAEAGIAVVAAGHGATSQGELVARLQRDAAASPSAIGVIVFGLQQLDAGQAVADYSITGATRSVAANCRNAGVSVDTLQR